MNTQNNQYLDDYVEKYRDINENSLEKLLCHIELLVFPLLS